MHNTHIVDIEVVLLVGQTVDAGFGDQVGEEIGVVGHLRPNCGAESTGDLVDVGYVFDFVALDRVQQLDGFFGSLFVAQEDL